MSEKQSLLANDAFQPETALDSEKLIPNANPHITNRARRRGILLATLGILAAGVCAMHFFMHAWHRQSVDSALNNRLKLFEIDLNTEFWRNNALWNDFGYSPVADKYQFTSKDMKDFPVFPARMSFDFNSFYAGEPLSHHPEGPSHEHMHHGHKSHGHNMHMNHGHREGSNELKNSLHHPHRPFHPKKPHHPGEDFIVYRPSNGNFTLTPEEYAELLVTSTGGRTAAFLTERKPTDSNDNNVSGEVFFVIKNDTDTDTLIIEYKDNVDQDGMLVGLHVNITTPKSKDRHPRVLTIVKITVPKSKDLDNPLESIQVYAGAGLINSTVSRINKLSVGVGAGLTFLKNLKTNVAGVFAGFGHAVAVHVSADTFSSGVGIGSSFSYDIKAKIIDSRVAGGNLTMSAKLKGEEAILKGNVLHGRSLVAVSPSFSGFFDVKALFGHAKVFTNEDDVIIDPEETKWPGGHVSGHKGDGDQKVSLSTKFGKAILFIGNPHRKEFDLDTLDGMEMHGCGH